MRKRLMKFIILLLLILGGIYLLQRGNLLPSFSGIFKSKPVTIENSAIIIREINNLAQLYTITAYNEIAVDSTKKGWSLFKDSRIPTLLHLPNIKQRDQKLVLVGKGKVLAGINLAKLNEADIFTKDDSVALHLPASEILQVIINPSDFETFEETGTWADEEVIQVKARLRNKLIAKALEQNILQKATDKAVLVIGQFLRATGYKKVTIIANGKQVAQ